MSSVLKQPNIILCKDSNLLWVQSAVVWNVKCDEGL